LEKFLGTIRFLQLDLSKVWWLGFSQGEMFLFDVFNFIRPANLAIICSLPAVEIGGKFKGKNLC